MSFEKEDNADLESSELGTKDYWDSHYSAEIENFQDYGDIGDIWFGKEMLQRIVKWLNSDDNIKKEDSIIDLGCGNGWTLIMLGKLGFANLTGIDYSENAIKLAKDISVSENFPNIKYEVLDLVDTKCNLSGFNVALDKGTYDAISLSPDNSQMKRSKYKETVSDILNQEGLLIISSCNWTEPELKKYFQDRFTFLESIPSPKVFQFGGKVGNEYSTVVFKKKV